MIITYNWRIIFPDFYTYALYASLNSAKLIFWGFVRVPKQLI